MTVNKLRVINGADDNLKEEVLRAYVLDSVMLDDTYDADYDLILKSWAVWLCENELCNLSHILTKIRDMIVERKIDASSYLG